MARREPNNAGPTSIDGTEVYGEVWVEDSTAVFFDPGDPGNVRVLHSIVVELDAQGRLQLSGTDNDEVVHTWAAVPPARTIGFWRAADVQWPEEDPWLKATVTWTQYGVQVQRQGETTRTFVAAQTRTVGRFGYIDPYDAGPIQVALNQKRGCGCGK